MQTWLSFYSDRMNDVYRGHIRSQYGVHIDSVRRRLPAYGSALEIGCGMGNITRELHRTHRGAKLIASDLDPGMIGLTALNTEGISKRELLLADAVDLDFHPVDVIHSHGLLEHFSDEQIVRSISRQLQIAKALVHYVPSAKYVVPSFGNERLMTPSEWRAICSPDEIVEFNEGQDLVLLWNKGRRT